MWGNNSTWAYGGPNGTYGVWGAFESSGAPVAAGDGINTGKSANTCYDNGGVGGIEKYSTEVSNGTNVNCALSFKFQ